MKLYVALISFILTSLNQTALAARSLNAERWQTSHGARVVFYQAMEVPILDINIAFAAGSAFDGEHFGLSALTTRLLNQGSQSFDATQIAEQFADTGAQYHSEINRDMAVLQLRTLTDDKVLKPTIDTLSLIINKPSFNQRVFNHQKNQQLLIIDQQQESPSEVANQLFFNTLYQKHPYAHPIEGTKERINAITRYQVREFYKRYFVNNNAVIVLVGAIDSQKAHEIAEQLTEQLPKGEAATPIAKALPLAASEDIYSPYPSSQTMLRIGQLGIDHHSLDYFPLMVGNYMLGGGSLVSRLSIEIREKRGLTYGVTSQFIPMPGEGPFLISLSTKNSQAALAMKLTKKTLAKFLATGPEEDELQAARQYLTGSFPLSLASNTSIAGMLLRIAFYHLPDDYLDTYVARINTVTGPDIKQAFEKHIQLDKMLQISVGSKTPAAGIM